MLISCILAIIEFSIHCMELRHREWFAMTCFVHFDERSGESFTQIHFKSFWLFIAVTSLPVCGFLWSVWCIKKYFGSLWMCFMLDQFKEADQCLCCCYFFKSLLLSQIFHLISPPWYPNANQYFQLLFLDIVSLTSCFLGLCPPTPLKKVLPSISYHLSRSGSKGWSLSKALTLHSILNHLLKLT